MGHGRFKEEILLLRNFIACLFLSLYYNLYIYNQYNITVSFLMDF